MIRGKTLWGSDDKSEVNGYFNDVPRSLFEALEHSAHAFPDKPAVVLESGESFSFSELQNRADGLAAKLFSFGYTASSKFGLLIDNSIELFIALYAVNRLGGVSIMLPGKLKTNALLELLEHSQPDVVLTEPARRNQLDDLGFNFKVVQDLENQDTPLISCPNFEFKEDRISLIMYTSGTTSSPKAVAITNENIIQAARSYEQAFQLTEKDRLVFGVPLYHVTGVVAIIAQITLTSCTLYLQRRFEPTKFLEWAHSVQATYIHASPTVFELLLRSWPHGLQIPSIRILACGAANMPSSRILRLKCKLPKAEFRTIYGLTETSSPATIFPVDAASSKHLGSSGWPIPGVDIRIIANDGIEANFGEIGEIEVRGSTVCAGYITANRKLSTIEWLSTGDLGYLDHEGYLYVVDRKKDQINRGGEKIFPNIVEEAITRIIGVLDACVFSIPDELYGEVPAALYVAEGYIQSEQIKLELTETLAGYMIPTVFIPVDEIPKTAGLKADRQAARTIAESALHNHRSNS